jgi:2,3-dihydroxy-p-cumate/2,3-dihydroxybenzoate 3,4-dioxygenase
MITLSEIRYCRLGTKDLASSEWFAVNILGLQVADRRRDAVYFKSDDRDHTLCYFEGDPKDQSTAFEVPATEDLQEATSILDAAGHRFTFGTSEQCQLRKVREFIAFRDPSGNKIELVVRPAHSGISYRDARDVGITGFRHVGLFSTDPVRDEKFWTQICNTRVSDRIGDSPLLRIHEVHHSIAIVRAATCGIHHINHQVRSTDDVQRSTLFLRRNNVQIVYGPGRHPASSAQFLYFTGPDEVTFEYSTGVKMISDEPIYRERQLPTDFTGVCEWGSKPTISSLDLGNKTTRT